MLQGGGFSASHVLSVRDSTELAVELVHVSRLIRMRVENADFETSVLLTPDEAEWLRDTLVRGLRLLARSDDDRPMSKMA